MKFHEKLKNGNHVAQKICNTDETEVFLGGGGGGGGRLTKPNFQITKDNAKTGNRKANIFQHRSHKLKPSLSLT